MKSLLTLITLILGIASYGQVDYDKRLLSKYSEEKIEELIDKQPSLIDYWTYYLDNSYTIIDGEATGKFVITDQEVKIKTTLYRLSLLCTHNTNTTLVQPTMQTYKRTSL